MLAFAKKQEQEFIRIVTNKSVTELARELRLSQKEYDQSPMHIVAIDKIIREFIDRIIVFKTEKVNGRRTQRIRISYNCIGEINIPEKDEKTA